MFVMSAPGGCSRLVPSVAFSVLPACYETPFATFSYCHNDLFKHLVQTSMDWILWNWVTPYTIGPLVKAVHKVKFNTRDEGIWQRTKSQGGKAGIPITRWERSSGGRASPPYLPSSLSTLWRVLLSEYRESWGRAEENRILDSTSLFKLSLLIRRVWQYFMRFWSKIVGAPSTFPERMPHVHTYNFH